MAKEDTKHNKTSRTGKRSSPGSLTMRTGGSKGSEGKSASKGENKPASVCFLYRKAGHISTKCDIVNQQDDWIEISELTERVHDFASAERGSIRSDLLSKTTKTPQPDTKSDHQLTDLSFNHNLALSFHNSPWSIATTAEKPNVPSYNSYISNPDTTNLQQRDSSLHVDKNGWRRVVALDQTGKPWIQAKKSRR